MRHVKKRVETDELLKNDLRLLRLKNQVIGYNLIHFNRAIIYHLLLKVLYVMCT